MGWLIALGLLGLLAYAAWEFRGYLDELKRTWASDGADEPRPIPPQPELAGRRRST